MADLLASLAARALGQLESIRPRVAMPFERPTPVWLASPADDPTQNQSSEPAPAPSRLAPPSMPHETTAPTRHYPAPPVPSRPPRSPNLAALSSPEVVAGRLGAADRVSSDAPWAVDRRAEPATVIHIDGAADSPRPRRAVAIDPPSQPIRPPREADPPAPPALPSRQTTGPVEQLSRHESLALPTVPTPPPSRPTTTIGPRATPVVHRPAPPVPRPPSAVPRPEPSVVVSIGRVEVMVSRPVEAPRPTPPPVATGPRLSLDDYLARSRRGRP